MATNQPISPLGLAEFRSRENLMMIKICDFIDKEDYFGPIAVWFFLRAYRDIFSMEPGSLNLQQYGKEFKSDRSELEDKTLESLVANFIRDVAALSLEYDISGLMETPFTNNSKWNQRLVCLS